MNRLQRGMTFFGSQESVDTASTVVIGIPYDCTASFRPGARFAPREIRSYAVEGIEEFSFYFGKSIEETHFYDAGDLPVMCGAPKGMVDTVYDVSRKIIQSGRRIVGIGGEHLVTYPLFLAVFEKHPDLVMVHLDCSRRSARRVSW